jgi:group I intron endonuclease
MFYLVYKTTNKVNGKYYIGCHQTENLDDGYLGSGKLLKRAISKYGRDNFSVEIIEILEKKEDMFLLEKKLVNTECVNDNLSYNLKIGGSGGNPGIVGAFKGKRHSEVIKEKIREAALNQVTTEEKRRKLSENAWAKRDPEKQKEHARKISSKLKSDEHKKNISESLKKLGKQRKVECPHCQKSGGERAMKRHHFNNCKELSHKH